MTDNLKLITGRPIEWIVQVFDICRLVAWWLASTELCKGGRDSNFVVGHSIYYILRPCNKRGAIKNHPGALHLERWGPPMFPVCSKILAGCSWHLKANQSHPHTNNGWYLGSNHVHMSLSLWSDQVQGVSTVQLTTPWHSEHLIQKEHCRHLWQFNDMLALWN